MEVAKSNRILCRYLYTFFFHLLLAFTYTEIYVYIIKLFIPIYIENILRNPSSAHGLQSPNSRKPFPRDHAHKAIFYYFVLLAKRDRINIIINRSWPTQLYVIFASYLLLLPCNIITIIIIVIILIIITT